MIFVVRDWVRLPPALPGVPESLLTGIGSGLRFTRHSAPMRAILLRNLTFAFCASSLYALLPVIARDTLQMGPAGFGVLFGCFGAGAVVAALNIPGALQKHSLQRMVVAASLLWIIQSSSATDDGVACSAVRRGASWVGSRKPVRGTQSIAPAWVRARAVAMTFVGPDRLTKQRAGVSRLLKAPTWRSSAATTFLLFRAPSAFA
jgi:hypothetical protein